MSSKNEATQFHLRKKVLVDTSLQGVLIAAFVILQGVILSAALAYLYWRLDHLLDDLTFQVHFDHMPDIGKIFLQEGIKVIAASAAVNGAALLVADRLWNRYVRGVREQFRRTIARIASLDFRPGETPREKQIGSDHEVVALADTWLATERHYLCEINQTLGLLESTPLGDRKEFAIALSKLTTAVDAASAS